jgi:hypothetical protein
VASSRFALNGASADIGERPQERLRGHSPRANIFVNGNIFVNKVRSYFAGSGGMRDRVATLNIIQALSPRGAFNAQSQ